METQWQGSVEINAPVERVYAYLADFPKHCEWAQTLERMELRRPGDDRGVGAIYRTDERQAMHADRAPRGPLPAKAFKGTTECEVTELEPNRRIAWRAHPVPVTLGTSAQLAFDLEPLDASRTRLTQTVRLRQAWLPAQIFARLIFKTDSAGMEAKARAQWQASLHNIKAILEEDAAIVT
jgi:uncharacterized protein YndB with AHSA1/START domain